jgi:uncharacterized protein YraI
MKRRYAWLLSLAAFAPLAAMADSAWVTTPANLRAGPDVGYPSIAVLPAGTEVELYGCVDDWSWCDVETANERGWISAGLLDYDWDGQQVDVYDYGPQLSLPIVSFVFGTYWDNYYRGRPWYRQRNHWSNYHPVYRPRPPHRPVPHLPPRQPRPPHHADRPKPRPSTPLPARPVPRPHTAPSQQHDAPVTRPGDGHGITQPNRPRPAVQPARPAQPIRPATRPATPAQPSPRPIAQPVTKPAPRPVSRPSVQSRPQPAAKPAPRPVSRPSVQPRPQPAARPAAPKPASRPAAPERSHAPASHDNDKSDKQRR